jgi:nucleotide-binding universal stress UspA family protein
MSGSVVVGYTATDAGRDALRLGSRLAAGLGATLHLVIVLPSEGTRSPIVPPEKSYEQYLRSQAETWLRDAAVHVPAGVTRSAHVRFGESFGEGLIAAAEEFAASIIVIGGAGGGRFGRYTLGSVAQQLLHSSPVPVALAASGGVDADHPISRVTCAVGNRPGADYLLESSVALSRALGAELRLLSLAAIDLPGGMSADEARIAAGDRADEIQAEATAQLPDGQTVAVEVARGRSIEDATSHLDWDANEIALVGSSRLAQPRRLFLGSTAARMLHELPVPMIVVPRERPEGA